MNRQQIFNSLCTEGHTVGCVFVHTKYAAGNEKVYTYRVSSEMYEVIKEGNLAIIENGGEYSIVTIKEVHETSRIEAASKYRYKWLLCIVDTTDYHDNMEVENKLLADIEIDSKNVAKKEVATKAKTLISEDVANKISRL